ncbi:hypothetical protein NQ318_022127 [Aromia moschata]|uniref:Uncharacterized protein n=1 Tax=Aromia moschata TaxID=1265417 RepID=A0AAV8Z5H0_9CUCU|nr:hypothetical protein NQ318_022127 [Aromia moschata]
MRDVEMDIEKIIKQNGNQLVEPVRDAFFALANKENIEPKIKVRGVMTCFANAAASNDTPDLRLHSFFRLLL